MTRGQSHLCDELNHTFVLLQTQKNHWLVFLFCRVWNYNEKKNYIFIEFYCSWPETRVCDSPGKMSSCHFNTVWSFTNAAAFNNNLLLKLRSIFYLQSTVLTSENKILVVKNNQNFKDYLTFYHRSGFCRWLSPAVYLTSTLQLGCVVVVSLNSDTSLWPTAMEVSLIMKRNAEGKASVFYRHH